MKLHGKTAGRLMAMTLCVVLTCGISGCHKKVRAPQLPQIFATVALETPPPVQELPMVQEPEETMPPIPIAAAAARPRVQRRRPPATKAPASEPVQVASAEPTAEETAIGALTAGGEANPRMQQEAVDLIGANEKRLNTLSSQIVETEKAQISKVRNFQRQAQEALNSGDAEGAKTLATKAKLLLDDLVK